MNEEIMTLINNLSSEVYNGLSELNNRRIEQLNELIDDEKDFGKKELLINEKKQLISIFRNQVISYIKDNLTEQQLAELLNVSNRAVSKWERGKNLPDASLMLELSKILDISVNELLNGEKILKSDYVDKAENRLIELQKKNDEYEKTLLLLEYVIGFSSSITFIILIFIASYLNMPVLTRVLLIIAALIIFIVGVFYALRIERIAGYYECSKCKHKFIPTNKQMLFSMHIGRTRYIKCPKCKKTSWNKKVKTNTE